MSGTGVVHPWSVLGSDRAFGMDSGLGPRNQCGRFRGHPPHRIGASNIILASEAGGGNRHSGRPFWARIRLIDIWAAHGRPHNRQPRSP